MVDIILASASPRRAELLDQIGINYHVQAVDIDESAHKRETPNDLVLRLAKEKSQAVSHATLPVLGSDTIGIINGEVLTKPENYTHAKLMLQKLSGQWHEIYTAIAITQADKTQTILCKSRVLFRELTHSEIKAYWHTGEPCDKAGAYAIQGLAASFIKRIEGSYSGIMGLPLYETSQLLGQFGISVIKDNK